MENDEPSDNSPPADSTPQVRQADILAAIATVFDPEIPVNILELGLIYHVLVEGGAVAIDMTLTAPGCPSAQELPVMVHEAVLLVSGVTSVDVRTVWSPPWTMSRMSDEARLSMNMF
jgi:FeS assembly SUF system protein